MSATSSFLFLAFSTRFRIQPIRPSPDAPDLQSPARPHRVTSRCRRSRRVGSWWFTRGSPPRQIAWTAPTESTPSPAAFPGLQENRVSATRRRTPCPASRFGLRRLTGPADGAASKQAHRRRVTATTVRGMRQKPRLKIPDRAWDERVRNAIAVQKASPHLPFFVTSLEDTMV